MGDDIRVRTAFFTHHKTKRLVRKLGYEGPFRLMALWSFARENKPDGDLSGMTDEQIADAAGWSEDKDPKTLVDALVATMWLDGAEGSRTLHDWAEHNPHSVGQRMRDLQARWSALVRHHGKAYADEQVPEYAEHLAAKKKASSGTASGSAQSMPKADAPAYEQHADSTHAAVQTAMPLPTTLPTILPTTQKSNANAPDGAADEVSTVAAWVKESFAVWYEAYPNKIGKDAAMRAWHARLKKLKIKADGAMAYGASVRRNVLQRIAEDSRWIGGFIPNPATYINQGRCDEDPITFSAQAQSARRRELMNEAAAQAAMDNE